MSVLRWLFWPLIKARRFWLEHITTSGNTLILGLIATANVVWGYPLGPLFSAFIVLMFLAGILNQLYRPQLEFQIQGPTEVEKGELVTVVWTVRNQRRLGAYDLRLGFKDVPTGFELGPSPPVLDAIAPGGSVTITTTIRCIQRGIFSWPTLVLSSHYPFGLFRTTVSFRPLGSLAVTPRFIPLRGLRAAVATTTVSGTQLSDPQSGEAFQYLGSREYVPGTSVRRWDFSAWARLGKPTVREFESNRSPRILVWVDAATPNATSQNSRGAAEDPISEAIYSLAASIARAAINGGTRCKLVLSCDTTQKSSENSNVERRFDGRHASELRMDEQRLDNVLRRLAAGTSNRYEISARSLSEANNELTSVDTFLIVTGQRESVATIPDYLADSLPSLSSLQILVINARNKITSLRPGARRRSNDVTRASPANESPTVPV